MVTDRNKRTSLNTDLDCQNNATLGKFTPRKVVLLRFIALKPEGGQLSKLILFKVSRL